MNVCFHLKITCLIFNFALLFWTTSGCGQNVLTQTGAIALPNGKPIGAAFVLGKQRDVVTCWHVLEWARTNRHQTNLFFVNSNRTYALTVNRELPSYDLVTFSANPKIDGDPYPAGDFGKIKPGDWVSYVGFDSRYPTTNIAQMIIGDAKVKFKERIKVRGVETDALLFVGDGIFGYSGAPVFSTNSGNVEVVAIFATVGPKDTIYDGREGKQTMAYTIAPLLDAETNNPPLPLKPSATPKK